MHERLCVCSGHKAAAAPRARAAIACHSWINLKVLLLGMELAGKERHWPLVLVFVRIEALSRCAGPSLQVKVGAQTAAVQLLLRANQKAEGSLLPVCFPAASLYVAVVSAQPLKTIPLSTAKILTCPCKT